MSSNNLFRAAVAASIAFVPMAMAQQANNTMNPAISLILQGQYANYKQDPEAYELPGFMLGGEAGLNEAGFGIGHNELVISSNIDDLFYGKLTTAIADHEGSTEVELEEAYIETLGLGRGFTIKVGRFLSNVGYLNSQHNHAWDFIDAPLIYRGMFGDNLIDDGIQVRWLAPTDLFLQIGAETGRGERFPAGGAANDGNGTWAAFVEIGGDVSDSHSWQAGFSHWSADIAGREAGGHSHGGGTAETPTFIGDSDVSAIDFVWKWAPHGNFRQRNLKLQFEYFTRDEKGDIEMAGSNPLESSSYDGKQSGWYAQAVYQFMPQWRVGARYDQLKADNKGSDVDVLGEAGLDNEGHTPKRSSIMIDYAHSEFSLVRFQFNRDDSYEKSDDQIYLQYVTSIGSHGAHQF